MTERIIIPTRNEAGNIMRLVSEIGEVRPKAQIYFMDDSDTLDTMEAIEAAAKEFPWLNIQSYYREGSERVGKIVGAVRMGMQFAQIEGIERVLVMDGDGQHDPISIPEIFDKLDWNDVVMGSRYAPGGSSDGLDGPLRLILSMGATTMAKSLFPQRLAGVTDPMTGFCALRLDKINLDAINATGFKVLLEILLTHDGLTTYDVPVHFRKRKSDASKLDLSIIGEYLTQLITRRRQTPNGITSKRRLQPENV